MAIKKKKIVLTARERKRLRIRRKISGTDVKPRVSVFRSTKHIYAQVIVDGTSETLVTASTCEKDITSRVKVAEGIATNQSTSKKSISAAYTVGTLIAERLKAKGISKVVFDRNGYLYHGRIKAVAEGARAAGLEF